MSKVSIDTSTKGKIVRTLVTDEEEIRQSMAVADMIQHQLDNDPELKRHGKITLRRCVPADMYSEAQHAVENLHGDKLGNLGNGEDKVVLMDEFFDSKTGKKFMEV